MKELSHPLMHNNFTKSDLSEVISAIEKPLFEDKNSHKSGLLNAILILDSLIDLRNLKKLLS